MFYGVFFVHLEKLGGLICRGRVLKIVILTREKLSEVRNFCEVSIWLAICFFSCSQLLFSGTLFHLVRGAGWHKGCVNLVRAQHTAQGSMNLVRANSAGPCAQPCAHHSHRHKVCQPCARPRFRHKVCQPCARTLGRAQGRPQGR